MNVSILSICQFLRYIFWSCVFLTLWIRCIHIKHCYVILVSWPSYHYVGVSLYPTLLIFSALTSTLWTSLVAQTVKRLSTMQDSWVRSLGWEDPLEKEMAIQSSTIAWKIPWKEEPGRLQSIGSQRVRQDWAKWVSHILSESLLFNWISVFIVYLFPSFYCKLICVIFEV